MTNLKKSQNEDGQNEDGQRTACAFFKIKPSQIATTPRSKDKTQFGAVTNCVAVHARQARANCIPFVKSLDDCRLKIKSELFTLAKALTTSQIPELFSKSLLKWRGDAQAWLHVAVFQNRNVVQYVRLRRIAPNDWLAGNEVARWLLVLS